MFCLRSWLPLLFIPTNASPAFIFLFFVCTYFLNRPCVYCSVLLLILFTTSCNWSDRCFFDFGTTNWFQPRTTATNTTFTATHYSSSTSPYAQEGVRDELLGEAVWDMVNTTATALLGAVARGEWNNSDSSCCASHTDISNEWTGLGMGWLRSLLGKREWRIESLDIDVRL